MGSNEGMLISWPFPCVFQVRRPGQAECNAAEWFPGGKHETNRGKEALTICMVRSVDSQKMSILSCVLARK